MGATVLTQCVLQGICACLSYDASSEASCFGPIPSYRHFASRTDYGYAVEPHAAAAVVPLSVPDGCQPSLFFAFQRHTIRYPKVKNINESDELLPEIQRKLADKDNKGKLCESDIQSILNWTNPFTLGHDALITGSGRKVVREQVKRLRKRFPNVFKNRTSLENVVMDFSEKGNRSFETGEIFLREWFGDAIYEKEIAEIVNNQTNLLNNFKDSCDEMLAATGFIASTPQGEALKDSKPYKKFKRTIEKRLGFDLRKKQLKIIMTQCRFEMVSFNRSPWCALFSDEDFRILELLDDAESFDEDSYGTPRNQRVACPLAADMLDYIKQSAAANTTDIHPKVVLHFSHSGALKKLVTLFGIGREFDQDCSKRAWRLSSISPFNANFNAVYYKCLGEQKDKVAVLLNEKIMKLDGCGGDLCDATDFVALLESKAKNCDLKQICST
ncbi:multiple inositol polyphosphate phosphatase 1 [Galendromus occidentalis]|uniref:Multiple inositol polyphosphate phosphatase 1 n=1 Tax=Galendromus occidentalis TaxID=34638 RepID=A0AAJ6QMP1_9ACAR|nr:multiple inositol polyphosphate phosphatase 1 [Galendromus occidentalis]